MLAVRQSEGGCAGYYHSPNGTQREYDATSYFGRSALSLTKDLEGLRTVYLPLVIDDDDSAFRSMCRLSDPRGSPVAAI